MKDSGLNPWFSQKNPNASPPGDHILVFGRSNKSILRTIRENVKTRTKIKKAHTKSCPQPILLFPFSSETKPFIKNMTTKNAFVIRKATLDCNEVEDELFSSTQTHGTNASLEMTVSTRPRYFRLIVSVQRQPLRKSKRARQDSSPLSFTLKNF